MNSRNLLEWAARKQRKYGLGYSVTMPGMRLIEISRPDWIEYVQKTNFQNYVKGNLFQEVMSDVFGQGIFVTDGLAWKTARQSSTRIFNAHNFKTIVTPAMHATLDSLMQVLESHCHQEKVVELDDIFHRFTLEAFIKMTFSCDMGCLNLESNDEKEDSFAEAFDYVQKQLDLRFVLSAVSTQLGRILGNLPKIVKSRKTLEDYAYTLIDSRMKTINDENEKPKDLLGLFMGVIDEKGVSMTRSELKDSALNLIIAGRDTTAQALTWTFFHLIRNPLLVEEIRSEINEHSTEQEGLIGYDDYKSYTKTLAVFYEALRLHPPVPKNAKFAVKNDKIPNGPVVEAGDCLRWSDWQMARDPDLWGLDCADYKPSRWIDEDGKLKQFGQWKFHAFNGGPRLCIGMHLATFEAVAVIVEIVKTFELEFEPGWYENVPKLQPIDPGSPVDTPCYAASLTHPMAHRMRVVLRKRHLGQLVSERELEKNQSPQAL